MSQSKTISARERIERLLDAQSFVEIGALVHARSTDFNMPSKETPADGVVTGYGLIDDQLVYVFSQDASVLGGSIGEMHAKKIEKIYDMAMKMGAPVVGMYDCTGLRLQESTDALDALGRIYKKQTEASGIIPQYAAVIGQCGGGVALLTALSDFILMLDDASLFINSPNTLDGNRTEICNSAAVDFQSQKAGNVDIICEDMDVLCGQLRALIGMLPLNHEDVLDYAPCEDDLNRKIDDFSEIGDTAVVLGEISDGGQLIELKKNFAPEMVTAFIKLNGLTVGAVANRRTVIDEEGNEGQSFDNVLTAEGMEKAADFVRFCDAFSIPILTMIDTKGYEATLCNERRAGRAAAKLIHTFADVTAIKMTLITREAYGSAYLAMNAGHIGADMVFAWPTSHIGMMASDKAVKIIYNDELNASDDAMKLIAEKQAVYEALQNSPEAAAGRGYVDEVIAPEDTRQRLIAALEMLYSKKRCSAPKKHSTR